MKTGFIGAGKVGCSLGRYLVSRGVEVTGYYDRDTQAAAEAAEFTNTACYETTAGLAASCDMLFITVPDGRIRSVFLELLEEGSRETPAGSLSGKYIFHCSGSLSSREVFRPGPEQDGAGLLSYSLHPLFAVSDRFDSWQELGQAVFTLEGDPSHIDDMRDYFTKAGLAVQIIDPSSKTKYHLAAVCASNLICALLDQADRLLQECGFPEGDALKAISPLVRGNIDHVLADGAAAALTGPVERGDVTTLRKHLSVCGTEEDRQLYLQLSRKLLGLARRKHPDRDYSDLSRFLDQNRGTG